MGEGRGKGLEGATEDGTDERWTTGDFHHTVSAFKKHVQSRQGSGSLPKFPTKTMSNLRCRRAQGGRKGKFRQITRGSQLRDALSMLLPHLHGLSQELRQLFDYHGQWG